MIWNSKILKIFPLRQEQGQNDYSHDFYSYFTSGLAQCNKFTGQKEIKMFIDNMIEYVERLNGIFKKTIKPMNEFSKKQMMHSKYKKLQVFLYISKK